MFGSIGHIRDRLVEQAHRLQEVGVLGQYRQLALGLLGDLVESEQAVHIAGGEIGDDQPFGRRDRLQGVLVDGLLGDVGVAADVGALQDQHRRFQRGRLGDEPFRLVGPLAVKAEVAAVDHPAGAGLDTPGAGARDGVVDREAAQVEGAAS